MKGNAKLKILTISHYCSLYGANRSLLHLIEATKNIVDWIVICRTNKKELVNPFTEELEKLQVPYYAVPFATDTRTAGIKGFRNNRIYFLKELVVNGFWSTYVARLCRKQKINIIHSNSSIFCFGAYVSLLSGLPHVWHFREFIDKDYNQKYHFGFEYLTYWANKAQRIICISESIKKAGVEHRKISTSAPVIYNGVIAENNLPSFSYSEDVKKYRILIVGAILETKNQLEAIKAVELLVRKGYDIQLNIVGDTVGEYYEELVKYVETHALKSSVNFKGYINKTREIFKDADITLMCSRNEGMGRVTVESMAYGIPVVGFDAAGTSELIENFSNGILYSGDEKDLAGSIETLINDRLLYRKIQEQGQITVRYNFTNEQYAKKFLREIEAVIER